MHWKISEIENSNIDRSTANWSLKFLVKNKLLKVCTAEVFCCYFRLNIFWTARKMLLCVYSRIWFIRENFPNSKYWANSKLIESRVVVIIEIIYRITWISIPHWNIRRRGYRAKSISHWMNGWQSHSDSGNSESITAIHDYRNQ